MIDKQRKPKYATKLDSFDRLLHEGSEQGLYCNVFFDTLMKEYGAKKHSCTDGNVHTRVYIFPKREAKATLRYEHITSEMNIHVKLTAVGTKKQIKSIVDILEQANSELVSEQ